VKEGVYSSSGTSYPSAAARLYARTNHHESGRSHYAIGDGSEESTSIACACGWSVETITEDDAQDQFDEHQRTSRRRHLP
jgi:hypothetical protein